jgi:hypothetical protein
MYTLQAYNNSNKYLYKIPPFLPLVKGEIIPLFGKEG